MATLILSAAGAAIGAGFGGTVLGLSGAIIGRAVGATLGRMIDQRLMGGGSEVVEVGRIERFRVMGASEGAPVGKVFGRTRQGGQVIWATRFRESFSESGSGGKGLPKAPTLISYSYSVSLAIALCEGKILRVGRIWADGVEIARSGINLRVYRGGEDQLPDPKIAAVEGAGMAPAYRGIAYVVMEDLQLAAFGNRVPQFSFEVIREAQGEYADSTSDYQKSVRAVAMMPGTGEYALATTPVHFKLGPGSYKTANMHFPSGLSDFSTSLGHLREELPACGSISLVVSWFGDDLRCGSCLVQPKVEQNELDASRMPWRAGGIDRVAAEQVPLLNGRPVYGGTPADQSVIEAIRAIKAGGQEVMFYPFLLMEQMAGNTLPDPWSGSSGQPVLPWRGRITLSSAPGRPGTSDRTAAASTEVAAFFGSAQPGHFHVAGGAVEYSGPEEWKFRRFILHYAHLCALAGGVDAFCVGTEMRSLTQIRGAGDSFPAVTALRQLAAEVRAILGPATKISYAADWSEYFGYQDGEGNRYFHLDPLWSDPNVDFVGIDNYMPVSDWRDGENHKDAAWGSIYNTEYLKSNIAGGEGFDWYYGSPEGEAAQVREPITDGAYQEPWVFRYKDLKSWWSLPHHERAAGIRNSSPTAWVPESKPIRFTELGCPAIDKGTNEPNKFLDPKSSESHAPKYSNGRRDDLIQMQYVRAVSDFWADASNNPVSASYGGRMVDITRAHYWAWDARPFPSFPNLGSIWGDGANYSRGHWLNGRATGQVLASVVAEICEQSGVTAFDVTELYGYVRGFGLAGLETARSALQPLMLAYGFDAAERDGALHFQLRDRRLVATLSSDSLVVNPEIDGVVETSRAAEAEMVGRVRLGFVEAEGGFETRQTEATFPDDASLSVSQSELPLTLTMAEGRAIVARWLTEARIARDSVRFALPRSALAIGAGDIVALDGVRYRIDRAEQTDFQAIEAIRIEPSSYQANDASETFAASAEFAAPRPVFPVFPVFLDLPLLSGSEVPHAPHVAVGATPWQGPVAVWSSSSDDGYTLVHLVNQPTTIGITESPLLPARPGMIDGGLPLRVKVFGGALSSAEMQAVLSGSNLAAIGDGSADNWEVFQFIGAELVGPQTYMLTRRIRGQAGTDATSPSIWPEGSQIIFLGDGVEQLALPLSSRGLPRHYRIGLAQMGYDDQEVFHRIDAFAGIGLRPLRPSHLTARRGAMGDIDLSWIRRSRIDGDSWESFEVPLGEDRETYALRVMLGSSIVREIMVVTPGWTYSAGLQAADATLAGCTIAVAQVSDRFGPGPFATIAIGP